MASHTGFTVPDTCGVCLIWLKGKNKIHGKLSVQFSSADIILDLIVRSYWND